MYRALEFLAMIESIPLETLDVGTNSIAAASAILRRFSDQALTLVDALGLHVMAERRIRSCWSTDFHLSLTGVPLFIHTA